ncbi:3-oxoacyl-[acyl-carrier-protein] synthase III C-terminal domain-containing protein [Nostoc sp. UHCC 0926]|uniref:3-oxoacyl-ACP synthase III family protein n=1 Tax=unclassified Nostoc TaxID=2593658 RepID=UPI0023623D80|nr:3-oxoacyl-[acyl-carrier-protein] synthase III C-terminal domain-containing protein [Nostoc sp. UHCC 0926]WDD34254.1 3-oxoacyl-[acyl-carrier-protein] synthase III C-terminal domain-containing protein [Nostoc sp. UHCC 0926]
MVYPSVGISSLAVSFPSIRRTKDYYKEKYPEIVTQLEQKSLARMISLNNSTPSNKFELEMMPYLSDPFRGTVEQRILASNESSLTLEYRAAKDALEAAKLSVNDVDLLLVASFLPEQIGFGNAAFLARQMGLQCGAWNLDASCASTPIALQTACALVQAGIHRNVLVAISCTYSRFFDKDDTLSWFFSDGAGAFLVSSLKPNQGILGTKTVNTSILCDQFSFKLTEDKQGNQRFQMQVPKGTNKVIGETAADLLLTCCEGAIAAAGVTLEQIDFFIFNTPTAWFASFCTRVLGIDPERTINVYPLYANIGPALTVANLYHAADLGKIHENDLVLIYGFGAASSASASVMRWGNVTLGPVPVNEPDSPVKSSETKSIIPC